MKILWNDHCFNRSKYSSIHLLTESLDNFKTSQVKLPPTQNNDSVSQWKHTSWIVGTFCKQSPPLIDYQTVAIWVWLVSVSHGGRERGQLFFDQRLKMFINTCSIEDSVLMNSVPFQNWWHNDHIMFLGKLEQNKKKF